MTKKLLLLVLATAFTAHIGLYAQCIPGDQTTCPDPENNGQICPDSLPDAYLGIAYSVDATILPPPTVSYMTATAPLNKLVLLDVENLPPGLSWVSNVANNTFYPGTYYCVLLSGTPSSVGFYQLKIKVGVYITFLSNPLFIGENYDSTSLAINVMLPTTVQDIALEHSQACIVSPNPFSHQTSFLFNSSVNDHIQLDVFSLSGNLMHSIQTPVFEGENRVSLDARTFPPGIYLYRMISSEGLSTGRFTKLQ